MQITHKEELRTFIVETLTNKLRDVESAMMMVANNDRERLQDFGGWEFRHIALAIYADTTNVLGTDFELAKEFIFSVELMETSLAKAALLALYDEAHLVDGEDGEPTLVDSLTALEDEIKDEPDATEPKQEQAPE